MRRRVLVLSAIVAATVLLAGCTGSPEGDAGGGPGPPGEDGGDQPPTNYTLATWNQSGLLEAFPNGSEGYEIRHVEPGDGIPYEAPNLTEQGELVLHEIVWDEPREDPASSGREQFRLTDESEVSAWLDQRRNRSEARDLFETFARSVTDASASTIDAWADEFVDSRREAATGTDRRGHNFTLMTYDVRLDEPLSLDGLVVAVDDTGDRRETSMSLTVENATWRLSFDVPHATASRHGDGARIEVTATARGEAFALHGTQGNLTDEQVKQRTRETFDEIGLPEPTFDGLQIRPFVPR